MNIKFNHSKRKEYDFNDIFTEYSKNNTENLEQFTVGKYGLTTKLTDTCSYNIQNHKVFEPNTLLIGIGAEEVGVSVTEQGCVSPIYSTFKISNNFDSLFLKYLMPIIILQNKYKISHISTRRDYEIETSKLSKIKILLPSFEVQKEISRLLSLIDNKIENQDRTLTKLKQLKQSLLQLLFPINDDNFPQLRFKNFTSPWEQRKLGELSEKTFGGGTPNTSNNEYWNGDIPWFQSSDISDGKLFDIAPKKFISQDGLSKSAAQLIPENSIAIITRVGVGKLAFVPFSYTTSQDFLSLSRLKTEPFFTVYACCKKLQSELNAVQGTSIKGITKDELLAKQIMIPNYAEQRQIGAYFKSLDHLITLHQCECI